MLRHSHILLFLLLIITCVVLNTCTIKATEEELADYYYVVYGSDLCPECVKFKKELKAALLDFEYRPLENETYQHQLLAIAQVLGLNETPTIPFIIIMTSDLDRLVALGTVLSLHDLEVLIDQYAKDSRPIFRTIRGQVIALSNDVERKIIAIVKGSTIPALEERPSEEIQLGRYRIVMFSVPLCHACEEAKKVFTSRGIQVEEYDISKPRNLDMFYTIKRIVNSPSLEEVPLSIMFAEDKLIAIIDGKVESSVIDLILSESEHKGVRYYRLGELKELPHEQVELVLEALRGEYIIREHPNVGYLVALALSDSINPCTFLVYTAFLILLNLRYGKGWKVLGSGLSFILGIIVGYMGLGIAMYHTIVFIPKVIVVMIGVGFGLYSIVTGALEKPKLIAPKRSFRLLYRALGIIAAFGIGLMISFSLLPCSAGPYLVAIKTLASLSLQEALLYLILYNVIFVVPLFLILISAYVGLSVTRARELVAKYYRHLSIIAGALLIMLSIMLIL